MVKIGVVGTGYLGRLHARVLTEIPEAQVAGFVEPNDAIAADVSKTLGLKRVGSVAELAKQVDCAVVATTTVAHFDVARELMEAGAKFYEYGPAMYHTKEIIIDDVLVIAGSANFDNRSFRINDEANFNVLDREFAAREIIIFEQDKKQCRQLKIADLEKRSIFSKTADYVAGVFSPQF